MGDDPPWSEPSPIPGANMPDDYMSNNWTPPNGPAGGDPSLGYYGGTDQNPQQWYNPVTNQHGWLNKDYAGGRKHIYSDGGRPDWNNYRYQSLQIDQYKQHMPRWRAALKNGLGGIDPRDWDAAFGGNRGGLQLGALHGGDNVTSWIENGHVFVNSSPRSDGGPVSEGQASVYGGTGGIPNTSGVGSQDNPSFVGGSVFGSNSSAPTGFDAAGNPVYGGQSGGWNVPGGINVGGFGAGSAGSADRGNYDFFGRESMKRLIQGRNPNLGFGGRGDALRAFSSRSNTFHRGGRLRMLPFNQWGGAGFGGGGGGTPIGAGSTTQRQVQGAWQGRGPKHYDMGRGPIAPIFQGGPDPRIAPRGMPVAFSRPIASPYPAAMGWGGAPPPAPLGGQVLGGGPAFAPVPRSPMQLDPHQDPRLAAFWKGGSTRDPAKYISAGMTDTSPSTDTEMAAISPNESIFNTKQLGALSIIPSKKHKLLPSQIKAIFAAKRAKA